MWQRNLSRTPTPGRKGWEKNASQNSVRICYLKKKHLSETLAFLKHDFEIFWVHLKISACIRFMVLDLISYHCSHAFNGSNLQWLNIVLLPKFTWSWLFWRWLSGANCNPSWATEFILKCYLLFDWIEACLGILPFFPYSVTIQPPPLSLCITFWVILSSTLKRHTFCLHLAFNKFSKYLLAGFMGSLF